MNIDYKPAHEAIISMARTSKMLCNNVKDVGTLFEISKLYTDRVRVVRDYVISYTYLIDGVYKHNTTIAPIITTMGNNDISTHLIVPYYNSLMISLLKLVCSQTELATDVNDAHSIIRNIDSDLLLLSFGGSDKFKHTITKLVAVAKSILDSKHLSVFITSDYIKINGINFTEPSVMNELNDFFNTDDIETLELLASSYINRNDDLRFNDIKMMMDDYINAEGGTDDKINV